MFRDVLLAHLRLRKKLGSLAVLDKTLATNKDLDGVLQVEPMRLK